MKYYLVAKDQDKLIASNDIFIMLSDGSVTHNWNIILGKLLLFLNPRGLINIFYPFHSVLIKQ